MAKDDEKKGKGKAKSLTDQLKSMPFVNTSKDSKRYGERFTVVNRGGERFHKYEGGQLVADKSRGSATTRHTPGTRPTAEQVTASAPKPVSVNPAQQSVLDQIMAQAKANPTQALSVQTPAAQLAAEREAQRQAARTALKTARKRAGSGR